jgi:hypothetical protein
MNAGFAYDFSLNMARGIRQDVRTLNTAIQTIAENTARSEESQKKVQDIIKQQNKLFEQQQAITQGIADNISQFKRLAGLATGIYGVAQAITTLTDAGEHLDNMLVRHRIAFGGYTNALMAYKKFQGGIAEGNLFGTAEQFMDSASMLMRKGIHMTDEMTSTLNDWAGASGKSVTEVAQAINSAIEGNTSAFEEFGITEASMRTFQRYTGNTNAMRDAVLDFVKAQKQFENGAKNAPVTWENIAQRMKAMKDRFIEAIIGHTNDPNSLNNMVKRTINDVMTFLNKNAKFFKALATAISATLKWIFKQIANFVMWTVGKAQAAIDTLQKYMSNYKDRIAGFILFLELMKLRVLDFFRAHKDAIMFALKMYGYYRIAKFALAIPISIVKSVLAYIKSIQLLYVTLSSNVAVQNFRKGLVSIATTIWKSVIPAITAFITQTFALNTVLKANPIVRIVMLIVGLVVAIFSLIKGIIWLVRNWKQVLTGFTKLGGQYPAIKMLFDYLMFVPRLMIQAFSELFKLMKTGAMIVYNSFYYVILKIKKWLISVGVAIKDWFIGLGRSVYDWFIAPVVSGVTAAFTWIWDNLMPDWLVDFGGWLYSSLVSVGSKIADFFKGILSYIDPRKWFSSANKEAQKLNEMIAQKVEQEGGKAWKAKPKSSGDSKGTSSGLNMMDAFKDPLAYMNAAKNTPIAADRGLLPSANSVTNDNSMEFQENSIQINLQSEGYSEKDAENLQKELDKELKKMQRQKSLP